MTIARQLVRTWRDVTALPEPVVRVAKMHLLDSIGVGLAASRQPAGEPYRRLTKDVASGGPSSIFGARAGAAAADAAMINGGLIHSLEFDDTHTASIAHGSSVMTSSTLAGGESSGSSGANLVRAFVLGWEALVRIGVAAPGSFQACGFQVTSIGGALVSALIAADLAQIDEDQRVAAVGIALSQASGVFEFLSNGSTVKSLHSGWAAHSGIVAASLARAGMTGPETTFEGRFGLFRCFANDPDAADRFAGELTTFGRHWHLIDAAYKFYPCCHYLHPFIEAARLLQDLGVAAGDVHSIVLHVPSGASGIICEPWESKLKVTSGHAMRWSLPLVFASQMVDGKIGLDTFCHPPGRNVSDLAARVTWVPLRDDAFPERFQAEAECRLRSGAVRRVRVDDAYGNTSRPPAFEEILKKFHSNASGVVPAHTADALAAEIMTIDTAKDLKSLGRLLRCN